MGATLKSRILVLVLSTLILVATFVAISETLAAVNQASKNPGSAAASKSQSKDSGPAAQSKPESKEPTTVSESKQESKQESKESPSYENFILQASGKAYDTQNHKWVCVSVSLSGRVEGKISKTLTLHSKDGAITVQGYGVFDAEVSNGVLIPRKDFEHMMILLSPTYYGGSKSVWLIWGAPENAADGTIPIGLTADSVNLPLPGHPELTQLTLSGTIQLS